MYPYQGQNGDFMQMQMMGPGAANLMMGGLNLGGSINNNTFIFFGNSIALESRLDGFTSQDFLKVVDANISVNGTEIQPTSKWSFYCTIIWGSIVLFPLFFFCMDWWKRCTYSAYNIAPSVYRSLRKLLQALNLKNLSLTICDNTFNAEKANILLEMISKSRLRGFTLINTAGDYNFNGNENSDFPNYMQPFKKLHNVETDLRWGTRIAF